jgi:hypothetical protein
MNTGITDIAHLAHCRQALAAAEIDVRAAKDEFEVIKASAERAAIERMNGSAGKNEEERKRNLLLALAADPHYQRALAMLRRCEAEVTRAQAELEIAQDQRRAEEWGIRLALIAALDRQRVHAEQPGDDSSFDDVTDDEYLEALAAQAEGPIRIPDHMSNGNLESEFYANKPRPRPTYAGHEEGVYF